MGTQSDTPLLSVRDLHVAYRGRGGQHTALAGVDLDVRPGEVVALVGESGSGKSSLAHAILGMLSSAGSITAGSIRFEARELVGLAEPELAQLRGRRIGWIPQDPMVSLNPLHRIGRQVVEPLAAHRLASKAGLPQKAVELLRRVGLNSPADRARQFPHELSGGMRQRVLIAGALATDPALVIADEPTTALDVTAQKVILDDLAGLVRTSGAAVLLITHDLALAAERAHRVVVLRHGRIVEQGEGARLFREPEQDYTRLLVASTPRLAAPPPPRPPVEGGELAAVDQVTKRFARPTAEGGSSAFAAVDGVSLAIRRGETLGLVGESGSGKSTLARLLLGLAAPSAGTVRFDGADIATHERAARRAFRRSAQIVYQNPFASLDPRMSVLDIVAEPLAGFRLGDRAWRRARALELIEQVGLTAAHAARRPAELSGGQRQRVAIARALAPEPELVVCDEPVSALDVSIQAQILELLGALQRRLGLSYLFISHDLAVVRQVSDRVAVMKDGALVEIGPAERIFADPRHPYTRELLRAVPGADLGRAA